MGAPYLCADLGELVPEEVSARQKLALEKVAVAVGRRLERLMRSIGLFAAATRAETSIMMCKTVSQPKDVELYCSRDMIKSAKLMPKRTFLYVPR